MVEVCCWYLVLYMHQGGMTTIPRHYATKAACVDAGAAFALEAKGYSNGRYSCVHNPNRALSK